MSFSNFFQLTTQIYSRYNMLILKSRYFRKKWYNSELLTSIIEIYTIFQVSQKWYFPNLRQFVKWQYIHGSLYCPRSFRKEFGEEVRCHSIVPSTKNDLGGILVNFFVQKSC